MIKRCTNPKNASFKSHGNRGIRVCARWRDSFQNFLQDMGEKPPGTCLERIDNNGNYEPGNCKWATFKEQANNRRSNRLITFEGVTLTLAQWAQKINITPETLHERLKRWPLEKALTQPRRPYQLTLPSIAP